MVKRFERSNGLDTALYKNIPFCVCLVSVGAGSRRSPHSAPVVRSAAQVQEVARSWQDPAHPVYGQPVHEGVVRLPQDSCQRHTHRQGRL